MCLCSFSINNHSILSRREPKIISDSKLVRARSVGTVKYNFARTNYYTLDQYLSSVDCVALFSSTSCNEIDGLWHKFNEAINATNFKYSKWTKVLIPSSISHKNPC